MAPVKYQMLAEKLRFPNFFRIEYIYFELIGIDLSAVAWQLVIKRPWITYSTTITTCVLIMAMCRHTWNHLDDLDVVCDGLTFIVQSALATWKAMIIVIKSRELFELLQLVWEEQLKGRRLLKHTFCHILRHPLRATEADVEIIAQENKMHWRLSSTYCGVTMVTGTLAAFLGIFASIILYASVGDFPYLTPFPTDFGFDIKQPLNYLVVYFTSLWGVYLIVFSTIGVDCLYSWCVLNVTAHFKVLQRRFRSLSDKRHNKPNETDYQKKSIIACIDYHQRAITLAKILASTFQPIVLLELTFNSTELCVIVYQIGRGAEFSKMMFLFCAMATILLQLLLYCYGAQQLESESEECAMVCYENVQWQIWSTRSKKFMILSILRAQRPCKMTAVFFDVNMKIFLWVLRTAASYVTLLWSLERH